MFAVETGQMSSVETGQMSAVETRQMSTGKTWRCPVAPFYICLVSAEDICLVFDSKSVLSQQQTPAASEAAWRSWRGSGQKLTKTIEFFCV